MILAIWRKSKKALSLLMLATAPPVVAVIKHNSMVIPGDRLIPSDGLQMPLHTVCAHPVHVIGLALVLEYQASKHIQHGAVLTKAVTCANPASVVYQRRSAIFLGHDLSIVCFAPVLHVVSHLQHLLG